MNKLLGEVEVEIQGKIYKLKPTFEAIAEMESRSGLSITGLINRALSGQLRMLDVTAVVYGGLLGAGDGESPLEFNELGNAIMLTGMTRFLAPVGKLIGSAYSGKPIDEIDASTVEKAGKKKKKAGPGQKS